jgi:GT2 family glycosyltransferase
MKISIILVNHNTEKLALDCIKSIQRHLSMAYEVILVDNASTHFDEAEFSALAHVKVIRSSQNMGFGGGNNLGAAAAQGEYLWLLNTDTLLPADHHIATLVSFLDSHPEYGAAAPLLVNELGEIQPGQTAYFPTVSRLILDKPAQWLTKLFPFAGRLFTRVNTDFLPLSEFDTDMAVAAAFMVKAEAFRKSGGFSTEFFMFYEDMDLCRKLHQRGQKIRFMPAARVIHLWGRSISSNWQRKKLYFKSQDTYFRKWHGNFTATIVSLLRVPLVLKHYLIGR